MVSINNGNNSFRRVPPKGRPTPPPPPPAPPAAPAAAAPANDSNSPAVVPTNTNSFSPKTLIVSGSDIMATMNMVSVNRVIGASKTTPVRFPNPTAPAEEPATVPADDGDTENIEGNDDNGYYTGTKVMRAPANGKGRTEEQERTYYNEDRTEKYTVKTITEYQNINGVDTATFIDETITYPDGRSKHSVKTFEFDEAGRIVSVITNETTKDAAGRTTAFETEFKVEYNADGSKTETRIEKRLNNDGSKSEITSTTEYYANGKLRSKEETCISTEADGSTVEDHSVANYDEEGHPVGKCGYEVTITDAAGHKTETQVKDSEYDQNGNLISSVFDNTLYDAEEKPIANASTTTNCKYKDGKLVSEVTIKTSKGTDGSTTDTKIETKYDANGDKTVITTETKYDAFDGSSKETTIESKYDAAGKPLSEVKSVTYRDAAGNTTVTKSEAEYDPTTGNPLSKAKTETFSGADGITHETKFEIKYDPATGKQLSNVSSDTLRDADGNETAIAYDIQYTYDPTTGKLLSQVRTETIQSPNGCETVTTTETKYNADGKPTSEIKTVTSRDAKGNETVTTTHTKTDYNSDGKPYRMDTNETCHNADGSRTETRSTTLYDADGSSSETKSVTYYGANNIRNRIVNTETSRDANGKLLSKTETVTDDLHDSDGKKAVTTYETIYDEDENPISSVTTSAIHSKYGERGTGKSETTYEYDSEGNLTCANSNSTLYDGHGNIVGYTETKTQYLYDDNGKVIGDIYNETIYDKDHNLITEKPEITNMYDT